MCNFMPWKLFILVAILIVTNNNSNNKERKYNYFITTNINILGPPPSYHVKCACACVLLSGILDCQLKGRSFVKLLLDHPRQNA